MFFEFPDDHFAFLSFFTCSHVIPFSTVHSLLFFTSVSAGFALFIFFCVFPFFTFVLFLFSISMFTVFFFFSFFHVSPTSSWFYLCFWTFSGHLPCGHEQSICNNKKCPNSQVFGLLFSRFRSPLFLLRRSGV